MNEPDDTKLMERCSKGDRQAFETLLVRYEKPVFNAAYRMLNSPDDARDVTQTVFLKAFEHIDRARGRLRRSPTDWHPRQNSNLRPTA